MDKRQASQLTTGILITAIGLLLLAGQFDVGWHFGRLWPLIFIVMGLGRYLSIDADGRRGNGGWFLFLGVIFLMNSFRVLMLHNSWPLFIVAAGVSIMFSRKHEGAGRVEPPAPTASSSPSGTPGGGGILP